jgi:hypothetical protein
MELWNSRRVDNPPTFQFRRKPPREDAMPLRLLIAMCVVAGATTAFAQDIEPIRVTARAKAACMSDALRLCRDAVPNVRNVLMCFGAHREEISNRCRTVLASYGLQ